MRTERHVVVIQPGGVTGQYWRDFWLFRELLYSLAWRDISVRYKQTLIGVAWSLVKPLATMTVFTIVFGAIAKLPSGGTPYAVFVLAALLPWQFFSSALQESSNSLIGNSGMVTKIYFPRLIIPVSAVIVSLIDLLLAFAVMLIFLWWYRVVPEWKLVALLPFILLAFGLAIGTGLWFSALNVQYRDFRFIVPFVIQLGVFVSPVGFGSAVVPQHWKLLYSLNPLVGIIDGFRWSIIPGQPIDWIAVAISVALTAILLFSGIWFFRRTERHFADII